MPTTVVKLVKPKLNPNAKWLVYTPATFNKLLFDTEIPLEVRKEVENNQGAQFFEADVTTKPITWGKPTQPPADWPQPAPSYFAKPKPGGETTAQVTDQVAPGTTGKVLVGRKMP